MDRFLFVFMTFLSISAHAKAEDITFTPFTPVSFVITKKDVAIVTYSIRNNTASVKKLNLVQIKGMKSLKSDGYCGAGIMLLPKKGCMLSLQLTGKDMEDDIHHMPFLCTPDLSKCYFPAHDDQMDIILKG